MNRRDPFEYFCMARSPHPVMVATLATVLSSLTLFQTASARAASPCENLTSLKLPNTTIDLAQTVEAGQLNLASNGGSENAGNNRARFNDLPAFCRVALTLKPTADSDIKMEVWLPVSGWNGKFQGIGNGGWAGSITYSDMAKGLKRGYVTASTDTGHVGGSGSFALGHPEKLIDFGYRAIHEMTVKAKALTEAFYGSAPRYSYWLGCSSGGRQGLKEAQLYPSDYDGIIAGAPANPRSGLALWQTYVGLVALKDPASAIPVSKLPAIHAAVLEACDAMDGLKDGLLEDPTACHFDPKTLLCKAGDGPSCLTAPQAESVAKLLSPLKNPRTGAVLTPGLEPGSELDWSANITGKDPRSSAIDQFKYVVFQDPDWDWRTLNLDSDASKGEEMEKGIINATDPNIKTFLAHGKLLEYHGWADQNVPPLFSVEYYKRVLDTLGGEAKVKDSYRLFMVPGMWHCSGGDGPNTFDTLSALEQWVESNKAPDQIVASHSTDGKVDRTRPLCPYPQVAKYKGTGSIDEAANFTCKMP
jgi:Tannase and feruloyl esterase